MTTITYQQDQLTDNQINQIVALHRREIGQGFLSSLGDKALELIFTHAAHHPASVLIAAIDPATQQICGFVCGTSHIGSFYKTFLRQRLMSGLIYLVPKLLSPTKLWKALETLIYPAKKEVTDLPPAELLMIAVDRRYHGQGVAQSLFYGLAAAFANRGITSFKVVAGESLPHAQRFYRKFSPRQIETIQLHQGQNSFVYIYDIDQLSELRS